MKKILCHISLVSVSLFCTTTHGSVVDDVMYARDQLTDFLKTNEFSDYLISQTESDINKALSNEQFESVDYEANITAEDLLENEEESTERDTTVSYSIQKIDTSTIEDEDDVVHIVSKSDEAELAEDPEEGDDYDVDEGTDVTDGEGEPNAADKDEDSDKNDEPNAAKDPEDPEEEEEPNAAKDPEDPEEEGDEPNAAKDPEDPEEEDNEPNAAKDHEDPEEEDDEPNAAKDPGNPDEPEEPKYPWEGMNDPTHGDIGKYENQYKDDDPEDDPEEDTTLTQQIDQNIQQLINAQNQQINDLKQMLAQTMRNQSMPMNSVPNYSAQPQVDPNTALLAKTAENIFAPRHDQQSPLNNIVPGYGMPMQQNRSPSNYAEDGEDDDTPPPRRRQNKYEDYEDDEDDIPPPRRRRNRQNKSPDQDDEYDEQEDENPPRRRNNRTVNDDYDDTPSRSRNSRNDDIDDYDNRNSNPRRNNQNNRNNDDYDDRDQDYDDAEDNRNDQRSLRPQRRNTNKRDVGDNYDEDDVTNGENDREDNVEKPRERQVEQQKKEETIEQKIDEKPVAKEEKAPEEKKPVIKKKAAVKKKTNQAPCIPICMPQPCIPLQQICQYPYYFLQPQQISNQKCNYTPYSPVSVCNTPAQYKSYGLRCENIYDNKIYGEEKCYTA